jgi:ABC-type glucose/galactose transport system permease subunit
MRPVVLFGRQQFGARSLEKVERFLAMAVVVALILLELVDDVLQVFPSARDVAVAMLLIA